MNAIRTVEPITPEEVVQKKAELIPDAILIAANELIAENWDGNNSIFKIIDLKDRITKNFPGFEIKNIHWFDIEPIYRSAGWKVTYISPSRNENFEAHFKFTKQVKL